MKVLQLTNVARRDTPLLYRRTFTARAILSHGGADNVGIRIEFVLEHVPLGPIRISVKLLDDLDYPIVPVVAALKAHILKLDEHGELP